METASSNQKGSVAELAIAKEAAKLGIGVLMPMTEHGRYDLVLEIGGRLLRTQCKWARSDGEVIMVALATSRHTPLNGYVRTRYGSHEVDAVAAYCGDLDRCYFFPIALIEGRSAIHLRLTPAKNNQRVAINLATKYEFAGAVAQLEERRHGMAEAEGSSPFSSINKLPASNFVTAEEFGLHTPRYVQRSSAGESFLITRRGKPMARLVPLDEQEQLGVASPPERATL